MPQILLSDTSISELDVQACIFLLEHNFVFSDALDRLSSRYNINLKDIFAQRNFTGKVGSFVTIPTMYHKELRHLIFVGVGNVVSTEAYRRAIASGIRIAENNYLTSLAVHMPSAHTLNTTAYYVAQQMVIIASMAAYKFDHYITDPDRKAKVQKIVLCVTTADLNESEKGLHDALIIAHAVNTARHWIDLPPINLTPVDLSEKARQIAQDNNLKLTIFNEIEVTQMGMGGLSAVGRGSDNDSQFVILEYHASPSAPTICLVGKGITFDSGGLSIKPSNLMETMKEDMSGAAAVIAGIEAIARLKPHINVVALAPLAENLPSGKATKPGDIVRFYNGKTAEIKDTDAEGRLILADALSYAVKHHKPTAIVDFATLTGACAHALGPFFTGLMSQHDELVERIIRSAERSGDRVWRLPLDSDYKPAIKSTVADLSNIGSRRYRAGAITAAWFLKNFVEDTPWVHLDIAGTAFDVPDIPYYRPEGATGAGIRLLIDLVMNWK